MFHELQTTKNDDIYSVIYKDNVKDAMRTGSGFRHVISGAAVVLWVLGSVGGASPVSVRVSPVANHARRIIAARQLLQESPLIDGHNDLALNLRTFLNNKLKSFNFSSALKEQMVWNESRASQTDIPRLKDGKVAAQVWSTRVPCESQYLNAVQLLMEHVDVVRRMVSAHRQEMILAKSTQDIDTAFREGRLASLIGVEGGHSLGSSMGVIRSLYELGVRAITLTHRCHTPWAECAEKTTKKPNSRGLTPFGKEIVKELNRLGMMIDLSHSSAHTARDVLAQSEAPIIFSHSAMRALCDQPTNVPDDIVSLVVKNGGIIMISFSSSYLCCEQNASTSNVIDHINHARTMGGVDHVGLGAGYESIHRMPDGLPDVSSYPELFAELLKDPSWSLEDLKKLAGLNFLRVFKRIEEIRDSMVDTNPSEEIVPIHDIDSRWPCRYKFASLDARSS